MRSEKTIIFDRESFLPENTKASTAPAKANRVLEEIKIDDTKLIGASRLPIAFLLVDLKNYR